MTRLISRKTLLLLCLLLLAYSVHAFEVDGIVYRITSEELTVEVTSRSSKYEVDIVVPQTVKYNQKTYTVTDIGNKAFYRCSVLSGFELPSTIKTIGEYAFRGCSSLASVTIPNSVTTIENLAFDRCISLTAVTIPNSVTSIGFGAFLRCSGLLTLTIPNSVTSIGEYNQEIKGETNVEIIPVSA